MNSHLTPSPSPVTVKDPVCGMSVDPETARHHVEAQGATVYFCSARCLGKFVADPGAYQAKPEPPRAAASGGALYTCPMHPQIRQVGPGVCPICGMALEPVTVTADSGPNPELADMTRRFWVGLALALPVFVLEMGAHVMGHGRWVPAQISSWIQFALSTPVVLWAGWPFFTRGWTSLVTRKLNMFTLIAMGVGVAYGYSLFGVFAPGLFPPAFRGAMGAVPVYFEAAAVIIVPRARAGRRGACMRRRWWGSPVIVIGARNRVAAKPVPQITTSASCSVPSPVRTPPASRAVTCSVTTSTCSRARAGYQSLEKSSRLHPIG